jgi:hypothetical protein
MIKNVLPILRSGNDFVVSTGSPERLEDVAIHLGKMFGRNIGDNVLVQGPYACKGNGTRFYTLSADLRKPILTVSGYGLENRQSSRFFVAEGDCCENGSLASFNRYLGK